MNESVLLCQLPPEILTSIFEAVEDVLDLLQLSVSCSLLRESMNEVFCKRVLVQRYGVYDDCDNSKNAVVGMFLRTCHACRSSGTNNLPVHQIVRKRICADCTQTRVRTICLQDATKLYKLTKKGLAGLKEMKKRNPYHRKFAPMRLFLAMEVESISAAKAQAKALKLRRKEQKNKLKFANWGTRKKTVYR